MRKLTAVLAFVFLVSVCAAGLKHVCKHDALQQRIFDEMRKPNVRGIRTSVAYKNTTTGLKIHVDLRPMEAPTFDVLNHAQMTCYYSGQTINYEGRSYPCESADLSTTGKQETVRKISNAVFPLFAKFLSVYEVDGVIEIEEGIYSSDICIGGEHCRDDNTAGNVLTMSDEQLYVQVTMRPEDGNTYATGVALQFDNSMRPIVGHVNFNSRLMPENIQENSAQWKELMGVALHEMMHVLGFSNNMFPFFLNASSGELYDEPVMTDVNPADGHRASVLATPRVIEAVQNQFGCDSLIGAPLEDQGGAGTAASHWEKAVFMDEVMTGSASSTPVLSNVTLALLEDSGWYFPNYSYGERLLWGEKLGCDFVRSKCATGWPRRDGYFCTEKDKEGCTYDRTARGLCSMKNYNNLPEQYRHLEDGTLGGTVVLADYCPFTRGYSNGLCTDTTMQKSHIYGDEPGPDSKCFMSKVSIIPLLDLFNVPSQPLCYPMVCISTERIAVKIGGYWSECPSNKTLQKIHGYFGTLECPEAKAMCAEVPKGIFASETKYVPIPLMTSVSPKKAKAGDRITLCGENLNVNISIKIGTDCIKKEMVNASCVKCEINVTSGFKTVIGPVDITLANGDYKTIYDKAFIVTLDLKAWAKRNAFFLFSILFSLLLFIIVLITVMVKCHRTKKRYREYQARLRKAKAARKAKEERAARGEVEMDTVY